MNYLDIKLSDKVKVAVIGDIHEHREQFDKILEKINPGPNMIVVSVGDIYDKGFGIEAAEYIVDKFKTMSEAGYAFVIKGNHELKHLKQLRYQDKSPQLMWLEKQPLVLSFRFANNTRLTVVHGGVSPLHTWNDLNNSIDTSYIRAVDENGKAIPLKWIKTIDGKKELVPAKEGGVKWGEIYDGRYGYIASGHEAQRDGIPKFYNYCCNLDTAVFQTGILTAQIFSENGKEELISVSGIAKRPILENISIN